jgi:DNA-binding MarR family transcriptional regulator/GNAT superfamily N-acetyltransferase
MDAVTRIRSFNRAVTHQVGALHGHFLGRPRSLGASRVLYEIGADGLEVRRVRARLDLDSGYLSRLLRGLEAEGLIRTSRSPHDARVRIVSPTAAGRRELALLDRLSDQAATALLGRLTESQCATLVSAMESVELLLKAGTIRLEIEKPGSAAARTCLARYFAELGERFEASFDPGRSISASAEELTPPRGYFVLATLNGEPVGCGALKCQTGHGEIKRMWVEASCRGLGLGRRILQRLEELARSRRLPRLRLETNRTLIEAQRLYRASGYREVPAFNEEPYAHHWFEKDLRPPRRSRTRGSAARAT